MPLRSAVESIPARLRATLKSLAILGTVLVASTACTEDGRDSPEVALLVELPTAYHTPNGGDVASDGTIVFTVPNSMNNRALVRNGVIDEPVPAVIAAIDAENRVSTWYSFAEEDLTERGGIRPMDAAFGPDGNLYITDMAGSRVMRINVEDGRGVDADVVVEGIGMANGLTWKEDVLFVSASRLYRSEETQEASPVLVSGVYALTLEELAGDPIILRPYGEGSRDEHLFVTFESSNSLGIGADGVTIASDGNLYTAILEDGTIYRTTLDAQNRFVESEVHAADERMTSADGIAFSPTDARIYVADILANAVHAVDLDGNVTTLHQNEDTTGEDGELDAPVAVVVRGSQVIVMNQDFAVSATRNSAADRPFTISVFELD